LKLTERIFEYAKSHNLAIPDSLIASTVISIKLKLLTLNLKDFKYIDGLELIKAMFALRVEK